MLNNLISSGLVAYLGTLGVWFCLGFFNDGHFDVLSH